MISLKPTSKKYSPYYDSPKIWSLTQMAAGYLPNILDALGAKYKDGGKQFYGPCPVHDGDNPHAFSVFKRGHTAVCNWVCYTRGCHEDGNSLVDLVRKVRRCNQRDAIHFICTTIGVEYKDVTVDQQFFERETFCRTIDAFATKEVPTGLHKNDLVDKLQIPSSYYVSRGYSESILLRYFVGDCPAGGKRMTGRAVVPVFDDNGEYMVGCLGRARCDRCDKCDGYHGPGNCHNFPKWLNQEGFEAANTLYNYWGAKQSAKATGTMVLVEGAGDVWRLIENGIENVVGLYGAKLSDAQLIKLEKSGVFNLVVLTDEDEAGRKAAERIKQKCGRIFRLYFPRISSKDVGELGADRIDSDVRPIIERLANAEKTLRND